jgi:hypothetical protein
MSLRFLVPDIDYTIFKPEYATTYAAIIPTPADDLRLGYQAITTVTRHKIVPVLCLDRFESSPANTNPNPSKHVVALFFCLVLHPSSIQELTIFDNTEGEQSNALMQYVQSIKHRKHWSNEALSQQQPG